MSELRFGRMVLHDFKSFLGKHVIQLDRPAGLYYIQGRNKKRRRLGSNAVGKTTIWDGVSWVLWGTTGSDRRPANAVVPWSKPGAHTWGSVTFIKDGHRHKLKRSRNPNGLVHTLDGIARIIEQPAVANILGFSEEMFRRSVVLGQFEELFLDLLPEKQSRLFNEALDLEVWLKASKAADRKRRETLEKCFVLRDKFSKLIGERGSYKKSLESARTAFKSFENKATIEERRLKNEMKRLRKVRAFSLKKEGFKNTKDIKVKIDKESEHNVELSTAAQKLHVELGGLQALYKASTRNLETKQGVKGRTCPTCGQKVSEEHLHGVTETILQERQDLKRKIKGKEAELAEIEDLFMDGTKKVEALQKTYSLSKHTDEALVQAEEELNRKQENPYQTTITSMKRALKTVRSEITKTDDKYAKLEKRVEIYSYWQDAFKEIRISLIDQILAELELAVTTNAEALGLEGYRIQFQTERENRKGDITVVFNVLLHTPDHDEPVKWQNYSGGERQRLQLAMAFGLSEVILDRVGINPNIEVLDEPTHHTSTEGVDDLLERLRERAAELNRAIYFCDHHSFDRGIFDGTLLVTKGREGSKLTSI